jgi:hypothetical protein
MNNGLQPDLRPDAIRRQMGAETDWVADKICKPFFRINLDGGIEESRELGNALALEGKRTGSTFPLRKLIDILMYVYFGETIPDRTPKPHEPAKPVTDGTNGKEVTTVTTGAGGNSGNSGAGGNPGNSGNSVTNGANDPAVVTDTTNKLADKTDKTDKTEDASKEAGTRTPVPTGTGTPAKEESFWDKNQYYIIGGIIGGLVLLLIVVFIVLSRRRTEAGYDQLGYSDQGSEYPLESLGDQGPEGLELEDLGGPEGPGEGPEGLGEETDPIRFGF